jgi:hypothetical protein
LFKIDVLEEIMSTGNHLYKGHVQIYLQGQNALIPIGEICKDQMTYFIGSKRSQLLIRDFRENAILAAQRALSGLDDTQFADIFNQPAYVEIIMADKVNDEEKIEVDLYPTAKIGDFPVLWMGVIDDLLMPILDTEWEFLRPISLKKVAFAAMVKAENFVEEEAPQPNPEEAVYFLD